MSKPPKVVIPGLNRGAGIPPGYILGRRRGTGKGPAELLDLAQMKGAGLATTAQVTQVVDQLSTALSTTTAAQVGAALMMGGEGEDGASGPPGQPGTAGAAGSPGGTGPAGPPGFALDGLDGEEGMPIPGLPGSAGSIGATGPQGPIGLGMDGDPGEDGTPMPGAPVVTTSTTASYSHALTPGTGINSIYRTDTAKSAWPYSSTVSSVVGTTLTLSSAVAQAAFEPTYMKGVVYMRIWNTTQNQSAWVSDAPTTSTLTVTNAADISTWVATDTIRLAEAAVSGLTNTYSVALDISQMLQAQLGKVFRQSAITIGCAIIPSAANTDTRMGIWSQLVSGAQSILAAEAVSELAGIIVQACKDLSPISNSNLVYLNDVTISPTSVSLANALAVVEDVSVVSGVTGGGGMAGAPGATGGTGPQGPMGFALDGQDGEEGMPIPGAPGATGAAGAGGVSVIGYPLLSATQTPGVNFYIMTFMIVDTALTINKVAFAMNAASATSKLQAFVYVSNAAGTPGALLGSSAQQTGVVAGYNEISLSAPVVLTKGTMIWIGLNVTTAALTGMWARPVGLSAFAANGSSTVPSDPAPAVTTFTTANAIYAIWGVT